MEAKSEPNLDAGIYDLVPDVLWFIVVAVIAWKAWPHVQIVLESIALRIRSGAAIEIGQIKLEGVRVEPGRASPNTRIVTSTDSSREHGRNEHYSSVNNTFLVATLQPSEKPSQLYDVLVYVVRHQASISEISFVEYYFGKHWRHEVYRTEDSDTRFAIVTGAHGPFLATARIHFKNGPHVEISRYVDFHTGPFPWREADAA